MSHGYITDDYLAVFNGRGKYDVLDKMRRDDKCTASLLSIKNPIIGANYHIECEENEELEELFEDVFFGNGEYSMKKPFTQYIKEILTCLGYGFSIFEIVYRKTDKGILPYDLLYLKQSTIDKWETQDWQLWVTQILKSQATYWKNKGSTTISIPSDKLILFTYDQEGDNYEWNSILRSAYRAWKQKDYIQKYQMRIAEKYAWGIIQAWTPTNAWEDDKVQYAKNLAKIASSRTNIITHPGSETDGWKFEFVDPKIPSGVNFDDIIAYQDRAIANATMTVFLNTSVWTEWSNARAQTEMDFFLIGVNSLAWTIIDVLNNYLLKPVWKINWWETPNIMVEPIELKKDFNLIASWYKTLVDSGILTPDETLEEFARKQFELPEKSEVQTQTTQPIQEPIQEETPDSEEIEAEDTETMCEHSHVDLSRIINAQMSESDFKTGLYYKHDRRYNFQIEKAKYEEKMNPEELSRILDEAEQILNEQFHAITQQNKEKLLKNIEKVLKENDLSLLNLTFSTVALTSFLTSLWKDMFEAGKKSAAEELGKDSEPTKGEVKGLIRSQNEEFSKIYASAITSGLTSYISQQIGARGGDIKLTPVNEILTNASKLIDTTEQRYLASAYTNNVTGMLNAWRTSTMEVNKKDIYAVQYSAILDSQTTQRCRNLNGRIFEYGSSDYYNYAPPGHYRCRSVYVIISKNEVTNPETGELYPDTPKIWSVPSSIPKTGPLSLMK